jgi:SNF2 family DNA or RNA helicase
LFFDNNNIKKSNLLIEFLKLSCKIIYLIFDLFNQHGPALVFSNFVNNEGIQIIKLYLHYFDFSSFNDKNDTKYKYIEFNGSIKDDLRNNNLINFNNIKNIDGSYIKIILISPAGSEGLNLKNVKSVHILEPYWNNVRIE